MAESTSPPNKPEKRHEVMNDIIKFAADKGKLDIVDYLINIDAKRFPSHRVNIHADEDRPLRRAAQYGHSETVKYLLECFPDTNIHAKNDQALRRAARYGHLEVVKP